MTTTLPAVRRARLALALAAFALPAAAFAQDAPPQAQTPPAAATPERRAPTTPPRANITTAPNPEQHRLPPDSTTKQTLALPGRTLAFSASVGSIRLYNDKGEPEADIVTTAY